MRTIIRIKIILSIIILDLCLISILSSTEAEEKYHLGFNDTSNFTLIYEYTFVDRDNLEYLYQTTGIEIYDDLSKIKEGDKFKLIITNIEGNDDYWDIITAFYSGKSLDEKKEDLETRVYKKPEDLVEKLFEESESKIAFMNFIPLDVEDYLEKFNHLIIDDSRYLEEPYKLYLDSDENELTFDYTPFGYSDTIIQKYNNDGILESTIILSNGKEAFKGELIDSYEDHSTIISSIAIIIVSIIAIVFIILFVYISRVKTKESEDPKNKIEKMLKKIK